MIHRHTTLGGIYSRLNRIERTCERMSRELAAIRRVIIQPRKADIDQVVERLRRTAIDMQRQARAERDSLSRNMRTH